eukprot:CAMPEP_0179853988 /NCGR_PEP_ID=MMETSP0982-20121206/9665_1 /TAXON_ID=483367 /ORGANISM="non described non described, Strain CCMP 2436" /LENGTH=132 /DNA_ID=CAMNT_0021739787 /DNA_START=569 /DNA_END=967 /DNA_ORIENTATION=-
MSCTGRPYAAANVSLEHPLLAVGGRIRIVRLALCAVGAEQLHHLEPSIPCSASIAERGAPISIFGKHVGARVEQEARALDAALGARAHQRSNAARIGVIQVDVGLEQGARTAHVPSIAHHEELPLRSRALPV